MNYYPDVSTSRDFFKTASKSQYSKTNKESKNAKDQDSINATPLMKMSIDSENMEKILIKDSHLVDSLEKNEEIENNTSNQNLTEEKKYMTKEEIDSLIENKKSELDILYYDMVTKSQVEEKKLEEMFNEETNEEEKNRLSEMMNLEIKNNEKSLSLLKE